MSNGMQNWVYSLYGLYLHPVNLKKGTSFYYNPQTGYCGNVIKKEEDIRAAGYVPGEEFLEQVKNGTLVVRFI